MVKTTSEFNFRRCDICDSPNIDWYSCDDKNHLCKEHRVKSDTYECGRGVEDES